MSTYFAQPYDISANGFYFEDYEEYTRKRLACLNDFGQSVEEFEIQFIDGDMIDVSLFNAIGVNQANLEAYLDEAEDWEEHEKIAVIIAVGECGYSFEFGNNSPDDFEVDIYYVDTMKKLAEQFVDDGLYGEIPDSLQFYIDYDAIARDLSMDYSETTIAGTRLIYRCS